MTDDQDRDLTAWEETTGTVVQLVPRSHSFVEPSTSLRPIGDSQADRARFAKALTPCLSLVAPTGMTENERSEWLHAAFLALRHLPADVIETGAAAAIKTADHPSKIVPAIAAAAEGEMAWRRRMRTSPVTETPTLPAPGQERCTADEAAEIVADLANRMKGFGAQSQREPWKPTEVKGGSGLPGRVPTREDYIRMGVDPAILDKIEAEKAEGSAA